MKKFYYNQCKFFGPYGRPPNGNHHHADDDSDDGEDDDDHAWLGKGAAKGGKNSEAKGSGKYGGEEHIKARALKRAATARAAATRARARVTVEKPEP